MKGIGKVALVLGFCALFMAAGTQAHAYRSCKAKEEMLQKKLEIAKSYGNWGQVRGLERKLANVRAWCSERDLLQEAEKEVLEKQAEVEERRQELAADDTPRAAGFPGPYPHTVRPGRFLSGSAAPHISFTWFFCYGVC